MSRVFSGVQPTSEAPHIGNYIGAFRQWVDLQEDHESFICIVDLHSITVPWDPGQLARNTRQLAANLLASGIDPEKSILFVQSDVPEHTELSWVLTCVARMGELQRMTQFKDKASKSGATGVGAGLFVYPVLMAADVLAYRADLVPVGDDQRQHLELMRNIAERFNRDFGETFPVPEALIPKQGARIMSLDDPTQKMSKSSDRETSNIWIIDPPEAVRAKIGGAVTDSGREIRYGPEKPAISNLLDIYSIVTSRSVDDIAGEYEGRGYAEFKQGLADAVIAFLQPFQNKFQELMDDPSGIDSILDKGADRAREVAAQTIRLVREKIGLRRP